MAKMTLVNELHPQGQCVLVGYGDDESYLLLHGVEKEVHVKRALSYLGDTNFKIVFDAADLALLSDDDYKWAAQLLQLGTIEAVKKHLTPKKKSTTQKVKDTVTAVTSAVAPTTTNDQSSDEADSANESE